MLCWVSSSGSPSPAERGPTPFLAKKLFAIRAVTHTRPSEWGRPGSRKGCRSCVGNIAVAPVSSATKRQYMAPKKRARAQNCTFVRAGCVLSIWAAASKDLKKALCHRVRKAAACRRYALVRKRWRCVVSVKRLARTQDCTLVRSGCVFADLGGSPYHRV